MFISTITLYIKVNGPCWVDNYCRLCLFHLTSAIASVVVKSCLVMLSSPQTIMCHTAVKIIPLFINLDIKIKLYANDLYSYVDII